MKRRMSLFLILLVIGLSNIFGQESGKDEISLGSEFVGNSPFIGHVGLYLSYERMLNQQLSFSVNVAGQANYSPFFILALIFLPEVSDAAGQINSFIFYTADSQIHWYPFRKDSVDNEFFQAHFHIDGGVGFSDLVMNFPSIIVTSGLGGKFIFGKSRVKFIYNIGLRGDVFFPLTGFPIINENIAIPYNLGIRSSIGLKF